MTGGILITPDLVVRCIAGTWSGLDIFSTVKQAQVICVLRAAGFIDGPDLSMDAMRVAAEQFVTLRMESAFDVFAEATA